MENWNIITPSTFAHEIEAFEFIRSGLSTSCHAFSNFTFIGLDGSLNEVDLMVIGPWGFFLCEIKSRPGVIKGDSQTWQWVDGQRIYSDDNPLLLTQRKCQKLRELFLKQRSMRDHQLPFLEPIIFLSHSSNRLDLPPEAGLRVFLRDTANRAGILGALNRREGHGLKAFDHPPINSPTLKAVQRAVLEIGLKPKTSARRVGDYELGRLLYESPSQTVQDWEATHVAVKSGPRLARIAEDPNIRLIEQPEYKRRWNTEPWDEQFQTAAQNWILARLETYFFESERMEGATSTNALRHSWPAGPAPQLFSLAQLVSTAQPDAALMMVMEEYTGTPAFDLSRQISTLLEEASVPYLPSLRYKESGLRKRQAWEETWALQRKEDEVEQAVRGQQSEGRDQLSEVSSQRSAVSELELVAEIRQQQQAVVGDIPVPPKYSGSGASSDFKKASYWKLRGKLDVPKERWVSYPKLETQAAPSPLYAWAGWNHLQQAQALAALYVDRKDRDGWDATQLTPLLAGLQDLIPWLQQWHNEEDPDYGMKLGDYFADYVEGERRAHGLTAEAIEQARLR